MTGHMLNNAGFTTLYLGNAVNIVLGTRIDDNSLIDCRRQVCLSSLLSQVGS